MPTIRYFTLLDFKKFLRKLEGKPFQSYQELCNSDVRYDSFSLHFIHIQGSPGAVPASVVQLTVTSKYISLPEWTASSPARKIATKDFILRTFNETTKCHARQNRGVDGSGSFQPLIIPQQVLSRNIVRLSPEAFSISFRISLPASRSNTILGCEAVMMLSVELPTIVEATKKKLLDHSKLRSFCETVEDMLFLQKELAAKKLVAFIGDNSLLARESGISDRPAQNNVVPFKAPQELAVSLELPNGGKIRGLGVRTGVTVLIGGGFHGKSTLLNTIARGIYPHIPGDGRERTISDKNSVVICSEEGRSVRDVDISGFISTLPDSSDAKKFNTQNASGSTSEAASIIENICAGAQLLLIDEDCSATNFLIRDRYMRKLIPDDPIIPLLDRVRELYEKNNISTLLIASGSSDYIGVADQVIAMRNYKPVCMDNQSKVLDIPRYHYVHEPLTIKDNRRVLEDNFDPSYENRRLQKTVPVRIKPLRGQEKNILEFGKDLLDLTKLSALIDSDQLSTIGYALFFARKKIIGKMRLSPSELATIVIDTIEKEGLDSLQIENAYPLFFSQIRTIELAGAMNRLRSLNIYRDTE
ncbi:MAG: ABC-ATPase domain-containing protein [Desulfocapsa sp.]|nr:ABC-ATPase domain-containing protein [Desulfocapsa sp.]